MKKLLAYRVFALLRGSRREDPPLCHSLNRQLVADAEELAHNSRAHKPGECLDSSGFTATSIIETRHGNREKQKHRGASKERACAACGSRGRVGSTTGSQSHRDITTGDGRSIPITRVPTSDDIRLHDDAVTLDHGPLSGAGAGKEQRDHEQDESFAPHGHSSLTSAGQTDWATEASAPFNRFPFRPARRQEGPFQFFARFSPTRLSPRRQEDDGRRAGSVLTWTQRHSRWRRRRLSTHIAGCCS
ncbi:hypothetical protein HPB52_010644 [Rhipicephalus sanguineus]|uniref:Uncharacterized protein n=1 Tax=Rhipicephalus sanguineus TaxID=34632 RepID=A0A9D4Q682_RHISA|nr:hypothetical protein HPB52_010644 [Rhipicephalus sanguineus]